MTWDLQDFRIVTVSAYPGLMGPLTTHPSTACVLSGDADNDHLVPAGTATQSLERLSGVRRRWRFGDVAGVADFVPKALADTPADTRPILLVAPRINEAWEQAAASWPAGMTLIGQPAAEVNRVAEDKVHVREQLSRLGVPVPPSLAATASELSYGAIVDALGSPVVLQAPHSACGQGTYLIGSQPELLAALTDRPEVERWLVSAYAGDITINVAGIVYTDGYEILPASVQSSDIPELGVDFGSYCGSDFGAAQNLPDAVLADAYRHTARIATWLRAIGHRGLFGADIAVDGTQVAFLEVNPRIQGSSWLLDELLRQQGLDGCLERHVQALLGRPAPGSSHRPPAIDSGSHLILRWRGRSQLVRSVPSVDQSTTVTGLPAVGTILMPGAIVARIRSDRSLAAPSGTSLVPGTAQFISTLLSSLETTTPSP